MRNRFTFLVGLLLFATCLITNVFSQNAKSIAGTYQWCPFPCETFRIKSDFSFDRLLTGDLFNYELTSGKWSFVGRSRIHLRTPQRRLLEKVIEAGNSQTGYIEIQATDHFGATFPGVKIRYSYADSERTCETNEDGHCTIPKTGSIIVEFLSAFEQYSFKNTQSTNLSLVVAYPDSVIDGVFEIRNDVICSIEKESDEVVNC